MKEAIDLLSKIIGPEQTTGKFVRKTISVILAFLVGIYAWEQYIEHSSGPLGEHPVHEVVEEKKESRYEVLELFNSMLSSERDIKSIWLYSWNISLNLIPVDNVGNSEDPIPMGVMQKSDKQALGSFIVGDCDTLGGRDDLVVCPILGKETTWGLVVVALEEETRRKDIIRRRAHALAHKVSLVLYGDN